MVRRMISARNRLSQSDRYCLFRSSVTLRRVTVGRDADGGKNWGVFEVGPRDVRTPMVFLTPVSGRADCYFLQMMYLAERGYRCLSLDYPVCWKVTDVLSSLDDLFQELNVTDVHLFGASLGGFLAQHFACYTFKATRVHSMILCNTFTDTSIFGQGSNASMLWLTPGYFLKKFIMESLKIHSSFDKGIADSLEFMADELNGLSQMELASRLTINCTHSYIQPEQLQNMPMTLIDVNDYCALTSKSLLDVLKCYPNSKRAHMKDGGSFPFLSRPDEVNVFLSIHLMQFENSSLSARRPVSEPDRCTAAAAVEDSEQNSSDPSSGKNADPLAGQEVTETYLLSSDT